MRIGGLTIIPVFVWISSARGQGVHQAPTKDAAHTFTGPNSDGVELSNLKHSFKPCSEFSIVPESPRNQELTPWCLRLTFGSSKKCQSVSSTLRVVLGVFFKGSQISPKCIENCMPKQQGERTKTGFKRLSLSILSRSLQVGFRFLDSCSLRSPVFPSPILGTGSVSKGKPPARVRSWLIRPQTLWSEPEFWFRAH